LQGGSGDDTFLIAADVTATLKGGPGDDRFRFGSVADPDDPTIVTVGNLTGSIDGQGGRDTLDYSGNGGVSIEVNLETSTTTSINGGIAGGFSGIDALIGGGNSGDTLIGIDSDNTWTILAADGGVVGALTFSAIENLVGGSADDSFRFIGPGPASPGRSPAGGRRRPTRWTTRRTAAWPSRSTCGRLRPPASTAAPPGASATSRI
jgi:hypothetical protein